MSASPVTYHIELLGPFRVVRSGADVSLPTDVERLVAFLAVQGGRLRRQYVAGTLWPDSSETRALGSLRSVLWRLRRRCPDLVEADRHHLGLSAGTTSDVCRLVAIADRLHRGVVLDGDHQPLTRELLPGWYEDWVGYERDRLRQLSMHALDAIASAHLEHRAYGQAIDVLGSLLRLDPFRESTTRQLIEAHVAEGNRVEAARLYARLTDMLERELGIPPSFQLPVT